MPVKQYRCVVNALSIRTQPQLGDQFKTSQQLKWGDVITINDDTRTETGGVAWLQHDKGWSAERSSDGKMIYLLDTSLKPTQRMWGINIDPYNPAGNPPAAKLAGTGWVRFVFHVSGQRQTIEQSYAYYDPIIKSYSSAGIKILLVIIHDTYLGNSPWTNGNWNDYIPGYANVLSQIAKRYKGQVAAYEIWNEGDLPPEQQSVPTSVYVPPQFYGPLLKAAVNAVRQADPAAKVISGGLVSGTAVDYMTKVRDSIGGLPMDGIGIHPYGQTIPDVIVFPTWSQGSLITYLNRMIDAFPGMPLWITEYGVPRVDVNNTDLWSPIANYMGKTFQLLRTSYFHIVSTVIWFAWADSMDHAGIVKDNQTPKGILFDTFTANVKADIPAPATRTVENPYAGKIMLTHVAGQFVAEQSITELAKNVFKFATNVNAMLVKTSAGPLWAGQADTKKTMAISSPADLQKWTAELAKYKLDFHAWHDISGQAVGAETALIAQVALTQGVDSMVLDLDVSRLILRTSNEIRAFMTELKKLLPATYHIGLSFDARPESFAAVNLPEWYPFINSWHPKVYHWLFSNAQQGPANYLKAVFEALKNYPKPIIPILQADAVGGKLVPPDQIKQAAALAFGTYHAPGISYWRLGAIGPDEFRAIQSIGKAGAVATGSADTLTALSNVRVRSTPSVVNDSNVTGAIKAGETITVLERSIVGAIVWVRHSRGWTVARNADTTDSYFG